MNSYQIPRNSLAWLLAAQVAVIAPHAARLPIWVMLVCLACVGWRVMVYQGRWNYPGRWTKVLLVIGGMIGIPLGYRTLLGLEPAIALLVVAYVLKLLEMHRKRDAYIVVLLGYFVAMTQFLFYQSIPWTIYMFTAVMWITAGLIGLNQTRSHMRPLVTLKTASVLMIQSIPMMVVLFVLFPRLPPLWTVPMPSQAARSGVSDEVSPGDIAQLASSSELAFKVTFEGDPPPSTQLYWRGLTLPDFDGRAWKQSALMFRSAWMSRGEAPDWVADVSKVGGEFHYTVILEPTQQRWLFTLTMPELPDDPDVVMLRDFRLGRLEPVSAKFRYELTSSLAYRSEQTLSDFWRYRYTLIQDEQLNPKTRALAQTLRAESGDVQEFIGLVLQRYRYENFVYSLRPMTLGANAIDEFMFDSRRGFCEHFASSFAFMMRAAGVPARLVVGYQGGEYNPVANYYSVFQYDAHAWTEVFVDGEGWIRVDPVTAVSPDRIERGLEAAVQQEDTFLADAPFSAMSRQMLWLVDLRLQLSAISYYWDSWIVGYTPGMQSELLSTYLGDDVDRKTLGILMLSLFFGILAVIGVFVLMKRSHRLLPPIDQEYLRFCRVLERQGLGRKIGEGPIAFGERVIAARPDLALQVTSVTQAYVEMNYTRSGSGDIARLKRAIRAYRLKALA